jgi:hypothetical protein
MEKVNLFELATYCQNRFKEEHSTKEDSYVKTLFVAITNEEDVIPSTTPHILKEAEQCILIHQRVLLDVYIYRSHYRVEFIDKYGVVHDQQLDNQFSLYTGLSSNNQTVMWLKYANKTIYTCTIPWENSIEKMWQLYSKVKDVKSPTEIKLIAELFQKDEKILDLEKQIEDFKFTKQLLEQQRNQYKSLLDEVKELLANK